MSTLADKPTSLVQATDVLFKLFKENTLSIILSDSRIISLDLQKISWLRWLLDASTAQRNNWSIEPGGYAVYWDDLDDGIEVCHLLQMHPLAC